MQGNAPPQGDVVYVHVIAALQPVVGDGLVFDIRRGRFFQQVVQREEYL